VGAPNCEDDVCPATTATTATAAAALFMARRTRGDAKLLPPLLPALVGRVADVGRGEAVAAAERMATEADGDDEEEDEVVVVEDDKEEEEDGDDEDDEALPPAFAALDSIAPTRAADDLSSSSAMASSASVSRFMFCCSSRFCAVNSSICATDHSGLEKMGAYEKPTTGEWRES
jgi:hypothetical protein